VVASVKIKKIRWSGYEVYVVGPSGFTRLKWKLQDMFGK